MSQAAAIKAGSAEFRRQEVALLVFLKLLFLVHEEGSEYRVSEELIVETLMYPLEAFPATKAII